jgi:hypothetical protein
MRLSKLLCVLWNRGVPAASANVIALLIQNVAIAHPKEPSAGLLVGSGQLESEWSSPRLFLSPLE